MGEIYVGEYSAGSHHADEHESLENNEGICSCRGSCPGHVKRIWKRFDYSWRARLIGAVVCSEGSSFRVVAEVSPQEVETRMVIAAAVAQNSAAAHQ